MQTQKHRQNRITDPPTPLAIYQTNAGVSANDTVAFEVDDVGSMVCVVVLGVGVVGSEVGCVHDTPAASRSKQTMMGPDGHSSKLFSLPVHSQSLTQMFPAPSPKRSAASV